MERYSKKYFKFNKDKPRYKDPEVKMVSKDEFLSKIEKFEPVHIPGYVCLF